MRNSQLFYTSANFHRKDSRAPGIDWDPNIYTHFTSSHPLPPSFLPSFLKSCLYLFKFSVIYGGQLSRYYGTFFSSTEIFSAMSKVFLLILRAEIINKALIGEESILSLTVFIKGHALWWVKLDQFYNTAWRQIGFTRRFLTFLQRGGGVW